MVLPLRDLPPFRSDAVVSCAHGSGRGVRKMEGDVWCEGPHLSESIVPPSEPPSPGTPRVTRLGTRARTHARRHAHARTRTHDLQTNRRAAQRRVRMSDSSSVGQSNKTEHVQRQQAPFCGDGRAAVILAYKGRRTVLPYGRTGLKLRQRHQSISHPLWSIKHAHTYTHTHTHTRRTRQTGTSESAECSILVS